MAEHFGGDISRGTFPSTIPALLSGLRDEEGINQAAGTKEARPAQRRPRRSGSAPTVQQVAPLPVPRIFRG